MTTFTVQQSVSLELRPCPRCGAFVALTPKQWKRREEGRDPDYDARGYTCPNGHVYGWWESATEREKKRADAAEARAVALQLSNDALLDQLNAKTKEAVGIKRRIEAGVCIHCHRTFQQLARHMKTKHEVKP